MIIWEELRERLQYHNMDADLPEEYLHISWDNLFNELKTNGCVK